MGALRHVLFVDDDEEICKVVRIGLEQHGRFRVSCAANSDEAWRLLVDRPQPDLAVIDALLPRESGIALAARAVGRSIPVVLVTGHPETAAQLSESGLAFLHKPFRLDELVKQADAIIQETHELQAETTKLLEHTRDTLRRLEMIDAVSSPGTRTDRAGDRASVIGTGVKDQA